jgi:hypothetical protein
MRLAGAIVCVLGLLACVAQADPLFQKDLAKGRYMRKAFGVVTEFTARMGRLWIYRRPINPVINVLVMFGPVMGGLRRRHIPGRGSNWLRLRATQ